ncbi:MAG: DUF4013 domain-containing protein [Candidatus Bruticola sp.]
MQFLSPINYIMESSQIIKKLFILLVFTIFIITSPAICGYTLRIIRTIRGGKQELPDLEFGDFSELFVDGLRCMVQLFIMVIPSLIFAFMGIAFFFSQRGGSVFGIICVGVSLLLILVVGYLSPAVFCLAAIDSDWMLAIKLGKIKDTMCSDHASYLKLFAFEFGWNLILNAICLVPFLSFVIPMFMVFIQGVLCGEYMRLIDPEGAVAEVYSLDSGSDENNDAYFE